MDNPNQDQIVSHEQIVPGISITSRGQATVAPSMADVLFDLALELENLTTHPVDVEHVLASIILAVRKGELDSKLPLSSRDPELVKVLAGHVNTVFTDFDGKLGKDD